MTAWQPISSAPRNVPVIITNGMVVEGASKCLYGDTWSAHTGTVLPYQDGDLGGTYYVGYTPTHWMPFPGPPAPKKRARAAA